MPTRSANAEWNGSLPEGTGRMAFGSGAFEGPYSFNSRMEEGPGTNPEELIGAAHAGCFSMALSGILGADGHEPDSIKTDAKVRFEKEGEGWAIKGVALTTRAARPGHGRRGLPQGGRGREGELPRLAGARGGRDQPGRGAGELARPPPAARLIAHSAIPITIRPPA